MEQPLVRSTTVLMIAAIIGVFALCLSALFAQVDVSDAGVTRTCGSAFDVATDRSGWELWWARDLDEPDRTGSWRPTSYEPLPGSRESSDGAGGVAVRTGNVVHGAGVAEASAAARNGDLRDTGGRQSTGSGSGQPRRRRCGLDAAGLIAVIVLVADADSTLFLYTDRLVVRGRGSDRADPGGGSPGLGRVLSLVSVAIGRSRRGRRR